MLELAGPLLASMRFPAVLLDDAFCVVAANQAAHQAAGSPPGFFEIVGGRLSLSLASASETLASILGGPSDVELERRVIGLTGDAQAKPARWLVVDPLPTSPQRLFLLTLRALEAIGTREESVVMQAWRLTRTEAALAVALSRGETVSSFADRAGREASTVRWHLRNILDKSGCTSQADLIRKTMLLCT